MLILKIYMLKLKNWQFLKYEIHKYLIRVLHDKSSQAYE